MKNNRLSGWLPIIKPAGLTSASVVRKVNKAFPGNKIGHAGTLDPFATGVLLLAFGEATKLITYAMEKPKSYTFTTVWGEARDTCDIEGAVISQSQHIPDPSSIRNILPKFCGTILQRPPQYSAIKIKGKRACDRMREGEEVILQPREVFVSSLEYLGSPQKNKSLFHMECHKGVYVRSIARDMGHALNTYAYVEQLNRTKCGGFEEKNSVELHKLLETKGDPEIRSMIARFDTMLDDIPAVLLDHKQLQCLRYGQSIPLPSSEISDDTIIACKGDNGVEALARHCDGHLIPKRVFNISPI